MRNPFKAKVRAERAFDEHLNNRIWRAQQLAELPGVTINEVREEALLEPHPDPRIGEFSLNTPYELIVDEALEEEYGGDPAQCTLIPFRGPDDDPAA